jgi:hypothetical protein
VACLQGGPNNRVVVRSSPTGTTTQRAQFRFPGALRIVVRARLKHARVRPELITARSAFQKNADDHFHVPEDGRVARQVCDEPISELPHKTDRWAVPELGAIRLSASPAQPASKRGACAIWSIFNAGTMKLGPCLWFGGGAGEPLPPLARASPGTPRRTRGGIKAERPNLRVVGRGSFRPLETMEDLLEKLFGALE